MNQEEKMSPIEGENVDNLSNVEQKIGGEHQAKKPKKITITVDEDDPCLKGKLAQEVNKDTDKKDSKRRFPKTPGNDPRFQQQNQTIRCFVMYTDFYRCEHILGEGTEACSWFKKVFTSICPIAWIKRWDELRVDGRLPWHKHRTQGNFPGTSYGD